nr:hypothetical protein [Tanacetum cinerariifolium]
DDEEEIAKIDEPKDTESGGGDEEETESDEESAEDETKEEEEEIFDPIPRTPEDSEDDGNGEEDQGLRVSEEQRLIKKEEADELYRDTDRLHDSYQRENDEFLKTIDDNMKRIIKEHVKSQIKDQVLRILPRIEQSVNAQLESEVLTRSSHSSRTSYSVVADLSEMKLKKILIEKMEGNKSIQKDPLLDQTEGRRDEEKVGSLNQLALHQNPQPGVQAGLQQGLNLDRCQPVSLLLQWNLCRLPVRWTNPHIRCLKQV